MPMASHHVARAGWSALAVIVGAELVVAVALGRGLTGVPYGDLLVDVTIVGAGVLLGWKRPANPIGPLMLAFALLGATQNLAEVYAVRADADAWPVPGLALSLGASLWIPALFLPVTVLLVLYPSGRLPSARWRWVVGTAVAGMTVTTVAVGTSPGATDSVVPGGRPLVALAPDVGLGLGAAGALLLVVTMVLSIAGALRRLWHAGFPERQQLLWLLVTSTVLVVVAFASPWVWLFDLTLALIPTAIAVGVLRYRMLGIEVIVRRTLVYGTLTAAVVAVYAAVAALGARLSTSGPVPAVTGAAIVAVVLMPLRDRLQRGVDRLVYGDRRDPLAAVHRVGVRLSTEVDSLAAVTDALASAIRATYVAIVDEHGAVLAATGGHRAAHLHRALTFGGAPVGTLMVAAASGEDELAAADVRTVDALAVPIAAALSARRVNRELDAARERLVQATSTERSRLRRDLHDGLGPSLSGVALGLDAARATLTSDPDRTAEILHRLREEMARAVEEVRRIIDALHPAALANRSLLAAVRERAASVTASHGLTVRVEEAAPLPALPPLVEAAAYRIVDEAIANVVRHAGARECVVRVSAGATLLPDSAPRASLELIIEVRDDGRWREPTPGSNRVGLQSMRQRAEELGGGFEVHPSPTGSTVVATIPAVAR